MTRDRVGELDARGWRCPMPVVLMEARLRRMAPGERLLVVADDPVAAVDIPHFCRAGGHAALRLPDRTGACVFQVTRGGNPSAGPPSTAG